ncbi:MAG: hypothetical protein WAX77_00185 [Methylococcaceae bacterium]
MKRIPISLISNATKEIVEAHLIDGVTRDLVVQTEITSWSEPRLEAVKRLHANGIDLPEHWHWNWVKKSTKIKLLAYRCFGIECNKEMQGLMLVNTIHSSRLQNQKGKPLVYVDYIEVAPWNLKVFNPSPRYAAIGKRLIESAIRFSLAEGFGGRIGLHSLPQSEWFYENACYMTCGEIDVRYEGLRWFELTESNAKKFLGDKS